MPPARRRDIRRWGARRVRRRRRARLVGALGVLVVATALLLSAAPGAYAPSSRATFALAADDLVERFEDVVSRGGEREQAQPTGPSSATSSAAVTPSPQDSAVSSPPADGAPAAEPSAPEPQTQPAPTPAPAPASAAPAATDAGAAMSAEIVALTNSRRAAAGVPALDGSACATQQAQARASLLVAEGRFEHDPLGPVLEQCGAGTVGENLSLGYRTAQAAVQGWMDSPGHRENLLRTSFTQIGVACVTGSRGWLCAQVFVG